MKNLLLYVGIPMALVLAGCVGAFIELWLKGWKKRKKEALTARQPAVESKPFVSFDPQKPQKLKPCVNNEIGFEKLYAKYIVPTWIGLDRQPATGIEVAR